jgi:hypothetical protein
MILPAKMSGAEKRERMAIMEAAISSTMAHPNIVQTYTYTIKRATTTGVNRDSHLRCGHSPCVYVLEQHKSAAVQPCTMQFQPDGSSA